MKTAKELVNEIGLSVQPPRGVAIVLTEEPGAQPNWVAAAGIMEAVLTDKFSQKVAELRRTDPLVDWAEVDKGQTEARRVVKFSVPSHNVTMRWLFTTSSACEMPPSSSRCSSDTSWRGRTLLDRGI